MYLLFFSTLKFLPLQRDSYIDPGQPAMGTGKDHEIKWKSLVKIRHAEPGQGVGQHFVLVSFSCCDTIPEITN
jgi:hypothetical protein